MWEHGLDRSGIGYGQVVGNCKYHNKPSGSMKCRGFLDWLKTDWLLMKDSAPCRK